VHVLMNNCYRDYVQTNAATLASLLPGTIREGDRWR